MATSKTSSSSSKKHRIAVIGGDGIGPEVVIEALKVLRAAGAQLETTDFDLGGARYLRDGEVLSDETLAQLRKVHHLLCPSAPVANRFLQAAVRCKLAHRLLSGA
jgi:isocitrate/isopropylmalate dehydrogenase